MIKMIFNMRSGLTREFVGHGYEIPDSASDGAWVGILDEDDDPIALVAVDDISTIEIEYVEDTKEEEEEEEHRVTANGRMNLNDIINPFEYVNHNSTPYPRF